MLVERCFVAEGMQRNRLCVDTNACCQIDSTHEYCSQVRQLRFICLGGIGPAYLTPHASCAYEGLDFLRKPVGSQICALRSDVPDLWERSLLCNENAPHG